MIAFVEGVLEESQPLSAIVNVNGVGYHVHLSLNSSTKLPSVGNRVKLNTLLVVREDSQTLYGFMDLSERSAFVALTEKVSGIGPKIALNILSRLNVRALQEAVTQQNVQLLTQCPGIGKKTAERLVLELKDVFAKSPLVDAPGLVTMPDVGLTGLSKTQEDAIAALTTLGFKQADALKRVEKAWKGSGEEMTVEQLIKSALS